MATDGVAWEPEKHVNAVGGSSVEEAAARERATEILLKDLQMHGLSG